MDAATVRAAREEDAEAMAAIYVAAAREAWAHIHGEASLSTLEPPVERFRSEIASGDPRHRVLVAEDDDRVVAFAVTRPSEDEDADGKVVGELATFYSDPVVWGRGIGRQLLVEVIEALRRSGFNEATLWTAEDNRRPRRSFEAGGWTFDGTSRERTWRGVSFREVRYRIDLQAR
jgi:L-amino acid N-acyltransferase YncA